MSMSAPITPSKTIPSPHLAVITPNDSADLAQVPTRGVMVATGGALHVIDGNGNEVTVTVPAGVLPISIRRVYSTGTTATGLTALY